MKKIIKKLNNVYVKDMNSSYQVKRMVGYLKNMINSDMDIDTVAESVFSRIKEMDANIVGFDLCECDSHNNNLVNVIDVIDVEYLPEDAIVIDIAEFEHCTKSKLYHRFLAIKNLCDWKELTFKKEEIEKFLERKDLTTEIKDLAIAVHRSCLTNIVIEKYNNRLQELIKANHYSIASRELLLNICGEETFGCIEICTNEDDETYEEIMLHLHMDYVNIYKERITYEGSGIFADVGISSNNYVHNSRGFAKELNDAVDRCSIVKSMFEVSFNNGFIWADKDDQVQKFISFEEFKVSVERQIWNIEQEAEVIFKNLYKLLLLVQTDMICTDNLH